MIILQTILVYIKMEFNLYFDKWPSPLKKGKSGKKGTGYFFRKK